MRRIKKGDKVLKNGLEGTVVTCKRKSILVQWCDHPKHVSYVNRTWFKRAILIFSK